MLKGNKGEWSEVYTFIKLLCDKQIFAGDKDLNKIPNLLYPLIKIIRNEKQETLEYLVKENIKVIRNDIEILSININELKNISTILLSKIKTGKKTFEIPEIETFLKKIQCNSLKAHSSVKTDIRLVIHDLKTNHQPELGFSIKSQLGNPSTLLNAGKTTNIIYKINGNMSDSLASEVNSINGSGKIKNRLDTLAHNNCNLEFINFENKIFKNNLILIDSLLPEIIANLIVEFFTSTRSKITLLSNVITANNHLNFDVTHNHKYYEYKLKKFLTEIAIGMMPATVWTGTYDATGGYLIVKSNGEVLAYHLYNRNQFEDYLFHNTKLDTASSSRHGFGSIYKEKQDYFIKLNLQIRFIK